MHRKPTQRYTRTSKNNTKVIDNDKAPKDDSYSPPVPPRNLKTARDSPGTAGEYPPTKSPAKNTNGTSDNKMTENPENQAVPQPATTTLLNSKKQLNF